MPLGVDASLYPFIRAAKRVDEPVVTLIGSMHWYPGYSAARRLLTRLWPRIKARVPNARLQIVGWNACKMLHEFRALPDVVVQENVADTGPYFERTSVFLYAPERGSGMKVKILEAMAYGVPVVTTSEGVEGLPAVDGEHAGISETDAGLVERTVRLLRDPRAQNRQRIAARQLVQRHCGPAQTLDGVEAMYDRMVHEQA
ncbi:MAG: glycosyltransferase family 4 protein [Planctomycetota bacterium]